MPNSKIDTLKKIAEMLNGNVSKEDFLASFKNVVQMVLKISKNLDANFTTFKQESEALLVALKNANDAELQSIKTDAVTAVGTAISGMLSDANDRMSAMQNAIDDVTNGKDTSEAAMLAKLQAEIPTLDQIGNLIPALGERIRDALELLQGKNRLTADAIDGLVELIQKIVSDAGKKTAGQMAGMINGRVGVQLYIDGVKKGTIANLNIVGQGGAAVAYSKVNGQDTITITASGGAGITVETPPEAPDATITQFTVSAQPKWVVADGTTYYAGAGYSYSAGTGKITMDIAPSTFIRAII